MVKRAFLLSALALSTGLLFAGCRSPRTEVIVVVDTDLLSGPLALDALIIDVTSPDGTTQSSTATLGGAEPPLPRTLGLLYTSGPIGPFRVHVEGRARGARVTARDATFSFVVGETRMLLMNLLASCLSTTCGAGETCGETGCRALLVPENELPPYTGTLPGLDASEAIDAARADAGLDAPLRMDTPLDTPPDVPLDTPPDVPRDVPPPCTDGDGDMVPAGAGCDGAVDCDDMDPLVFPGAIETCNTVDDDCDGMIDETFDLDTDPTRCGACDTPCDFRNETGGTCTGGMCVLGTCNAGFDDCNADARDGCEVDLSSDLLHCGTCPTECRPPDRVCCASVCSRTCP